LLHGKYGKGIQKRKNWGGKTVLVIHKKVSGGAARRIKAEKTECHRGQVLGHHLEEGHAKKKKKRVGVNVQKRVVTLGWGLGDRGDFPQKRGGRYGGQTGKKGPALKNRASESRRKKEKKSWFELKKRAQSPKEGR